MYNFNSGLLAYWFRGGISDTMAYIIPICAVFGCMILGYLLGSLNSAIIVSKLLYGDDIRKHGSGNAGLTNMLRTYGKGAAGLTLLGDFLKTALAILISGIFCGFGYVKGISVGYTFFDFPYVYIAGFFSVLGHIFPIFYNFKGGKGVLCASVMALILTPFEFLILLLVFVLMVAVSKFVSLGSVTAVVLYPIVVNAHFNIIWGSGTENGIIALITILLAILIVWCHRENLKRISEGKERKLSIGKRPPKSEDAATAAPTDNDAGSNANE